MQRGSILDAIRISDGEFVTLKKISCKDYPDEITIGTMFNSEPLKSDRKNHCVPIFEVLDVPDREDDFILVMPLLRDFRSPRFVTVGEVVEFFYEVTEVCIQHI